MDIVLEVLDSFFFDPLYAFALPASPPYNAWEAFKYGNESTATITSMREGATPVPTYQYKPATQFFSITPSRYAYMSRWPRDNMYRQGLSLWMITVIFGLLVYFLCAGLSYIFVFDKRTFSHPKFLKNQIRLEIKQTMTSIPFMAVLTMPFFLTEVRGYAKLYDEPSAQPFPYYNYLQFPFFLIFTDFWIYWIHRTLHHPYFYKRLHKPHHKWIMPTPFASHAFHPVDGWAQSVPYHVFPFLFPLQKLAYVFLFIFINVWTVLIHDGEYVANSPIINGAACHTAHHLYFNYNYGQYTTLWDRLGGSYRQPNPELFDKQTKMGKKEWERQTKEMEKIVGMVEGDDDRDYGDEARRIQKKIL